MENNNKKEINIKFNKKVISISFLALALFMLLSVSYAYFTATVTGNDEAKKTTLTTGKMSLVLHGETIIDGKDNMVPGDSVSIEFSVENTGTVATYYNLDMSEVKNTFVDKSDLVYSVKSDKGANKENTIAPSAPGTLIRNIRIEPGTKNIQEYTLTITFLETHSNQNSNQGKTFEGKVQINNAESSGLAAAILNSNPLQTTTIDFGKASPPNKICTEYNGSDDCISHEDDNTPNGTGLFAAEDDDGISYYFRGNEAELNNNVTFANKKWKIMRINGDGSIRLVLDGSTGTPSFFNNSPYQDQSVGFTYNNAKGKECTKAHPCEVTYNKSTNTFSNEKFNGTNSSVKTALETWYKANLNTVDDKIAATYFCNDTSGGEDTSDDSLYGDIVYGANDRISVFYNNNKPILKCPDPNSKTGNTRTYGGIYKTKIGLLTADEANMAGLADGIEMKNKPSVPNANGTNYLTLSLDDWMTMTPYRSGKYSGGHIDMMDIIGVDIKFSGDFVSNSNNVVPVINLKADVTFTGDGTESNPYMVS